MDGNIVPGFCLDMGCLFFFVGFAAIIYTRCNSLREVFYFEKQSEIKLRCLVRVCSYRRDADGQHATVAP